MATYTFDKIEYDGNVYVVADTTYTAQNPIGIDNNQISLKFNDGSSNKKITGISKATSSGISGLNIWYNDDLNNETSIFLPDGVGFNTGSQAIIAQIPTTAADLGISFGYTTSGNNRAVQQDGSGNLYVVQKDDNSDTKNTAGSTNSTSKLFLIGATEQSANPQTYSNSNLYYNKGLHSEVTDSNNIKTWLHQGEVTTGLYRTKNDAGVYLQLCSGTSNEEIRIGLSNSSSYKSVITVGGTYASPTLTLTNLVSPVNDNDAATKIYVDNKIGGSGTSGCLAKFNGTSTITSGPQLGSETTTYLRNDGNWAAPDYTKVQIIRW